MRAIQRILVIKINLGKITQVIKKEKASPGIVIQTNQTKATSQVRANPINQAIKKRINQVMKTNLERLERINLVKEVSQGMMIQVNIMEEASQAIKEQINQVKDTNLERLEQINQMKEISQEKVVILSNHQTMMAIHILALIKVNTIQVPDKTVQTMVRKTIPMVVLTIII